MAAWGPVEFELSGLEIAIVFALFGLFPPLVLAVFASLIHATVLARHQQEVVLGPLFLRWWLWCTLGWIAAWFLALLFSGS